MQNGSPILCYTLNHCYYNDPDTEQFRSIKSAGELLHYLLKLFSFLCSILKQVDIVLEERLSKPKKEIV